MAQYTATGFRELAAARFNGVTFGSTMESSIVANNVQETTS